MELTVELADQENRDAKDCSTITGHLEGELLGGVDLRDHACVVGQAHRLV